MNDEILHKEGQAEELSEDSLDSVAGGGAKDIEGVDIIIIKKPGGKASNPVAKLGS